MPLGFYASLLLGQLKLRPPRKRFALLSNGLGLCLALGILLGLAGIAAGGFAPSYSQGFGIFVDETSPVYRKLPDVENQLYGHSYPEQSVPQRISRIERTLFGFPQRGPTEVRMKGIEARINEKHSQAVRAEQEPMLVYLEEKLFQRTYPQKPTAERLRQLEIQVFGRSFDNYPVDIRMKKLTYAMPVMAREVRLSKGDSVIASTSRATKRLSRSPGTGGAKVEVVQLDAPGNSVRLQSSGTPISTGNYSPSIYKETTGNVLRWAKLPIKVYLKPGEAESALGGQVLQAWKSSFSVEPVSSSAQADVIVTWDKSTWDLNTMGVVTRPVVHVDEDRSIRTVILISLYPFRDLDTAKQLQVLSHELGHAFGIWGHSDDPGDVMYPALRQEMNDFPTRWAWHTAAVNTRVQPSEESASFHPSQRDINTLLKIYTLPATDITSFSPY